MPAERIRIACVQMNLSEDKDDNLEKLIVGDLERTHMDQIRRRVPSLASRRPEALPLAGPGLGLRPSIGERVPARKAEWDSDTEAILIED